MGDFDDFDKHEGLAHGDRLDPRMNRESCLFGKVLRVSIEFSGMPRGVQRGRRKMERLHRIHCDFCCSVDPNSKHIVCRCDYFAGWRGSRAVERARLRVTKRIGGREVKVTMRGRV